MVTPSGDVYIALSKGQWKGALYKNGEMLYLEEGAHASPFYYYGVTE